jgi:hypothetical protein
MPLIGGERLPLLMTCYFLQYESETDGGAKHLDIARIATANN